MKAATKGARDGIRTNSIMEKCYGMQREELSRQRLQQYLDMTKYS